jgi:3-oxoacyl-[acyl-carrier-protein] synthase-3
MAIARVSNVRVSGIAAAVPEHISGFEQTAAIFGETDARKISEMTGIRQRHVVVGRSCTSDLCYAAAVPLLEGLGYGADTIDALVVVTQTPDYILPATSNVLHGRLKLPKTCAAFDLNLGCSGYIYGLWVLSQLLSTGNLKRGLLLVGDTISRLASPEDRSVAPLFGDAGTATLLEYDPSAKEMVFTMGTDGTGERHLIVPAGGFRNPRTALTAQRNEREGSNVRSDQDLYMNGNEIFAFTLREVPAMLGALFDASAWDKETPDAYVFHQANRFMLDHLAKRMKLPVEKVHYALEKYGNTSSASIPLTIVDQLQTTLSQSSTNLLLAGFGVGFSWAGVTLTCDSPLISPLVIMPTTADEVMA